MAQQVTTSFIDDIDGSAAEGTVAFAIDGKMYDIDLSAAHAARLRESSRPMWVQPGELAAAGSPRDVLLPGPASARRTRPYGRGPRRRV